jgi:hypothetical protein
LHERVRTEIFNVTFVKTIEDKIFQVKRQGAVAQITAEKMLPVSCSLYEPSGESFLIPLTAPQNLIAKLFGQQPDKISHKKASFRELVLLKKPY